jgi:hypothetical protein
LGFVEFDRVSNEKMKPKAHGMPSVGLTQI